ncbi:MAG: amino acid adenylation domain-containing protein [Nitrospira sp.]|nr:amino acid adenylation domain-containing protein [Nitrospira sp.]
MRQEIEVQGLRLSPQQKRLWLWQQQGQVGPASAVLTLDGSFGEKAVQESLRQVMARHDSLRTTFYRQAGMKLPFQVVGEGSELDWRTVDLCHLADDVEKERAADKAARRSDDFDWERGPLVRATFCRFTETHAQLFVDVPALCADMRSLWNLALELSRSLGGGGEAAEEPVQYGQYSEWQHELLEGQEAPQGQAWWARRRVTSEHRIALPFERDSSLEQFESPARPVRRELSVSGLTRLRDGAAAAKISLPVLLCGCWTALLYRITARRDLVCWWRSEGRPYEELSGGIGLYERWLPLHLRVEGNMQLRDFLPLVLREQSQAEDWQQYYPGEQAEEDLQAVRDAIGFEYTQRATPDRTAAGVLMLSDGTFSIEPLKVRLSCLEHEAGLAMSWHTDRQRIPAEIMESLADRYVELLRRLPQQLDIAIDDVDIVGNRERIRLTRELNQTARAGEPPFLMHSLIEAQAKRHPAHTALVAASQRLSYDDLNRRANRVAHGLRRRGITIGDRVGLCIDRSVDMIVAMLGVLKAGAAYVPVDPAHATVRLAPNMAQSGASILLIETGSSRPGSEFSGATLNLREDFAAEPDDDLTLVQSPDELAYIIYTSGSTGQPKGVAVSHRNLVNYTSAITERMQLQEQWQFATVSTLSADLGHTVVFPALTSGGCLHVIGYETATDGQSFASYLAQHPIDVLKIVPSHFNALLATGEGHAVWPRQLLVFGGETLPWDLADAVMRQATCRVINHYGPTETTVGATTMIVTDDPDLRIARSVPIGRPIDNLEAYILDHRQEPVPIGVAGELYLGGFGVARGYWNQPDRTAERFVPNPHTSQRGARLYRTGDRTRRLPDGSIEFLGRVDHQVKIRGFRIELGEIESVLRQHPAIQDAVVTVRDDKQIEPYLAAYLVPRGVAPHSRTIQDFLRARLPDYMVPMTITALPALPLTANGKVDRRALPDPERDGQGARRFVAPATATEEILAGIWADVLKREEIGTQDNFFDLGGHSLLATQVMSRLRNAFVVELPLRALFEAPTVARLAQMVDAAKRTDLGEQAPPLTAIPRTGPIPLSFAQQRLWVLAQLEPDSTAYHIPIALRVRGALDAGALERSVHEVVRRHESLRTKFQRLNGVPMQVIGPAQPLSIPLIDLQHLPDERREQAAIRLAAVEAERPFDLRYGPLLRVSLIRLRSHEHLLLVTLHHIVSDAWSSHLLVKELTEVYDASVAGRPSSLPDLPLQYADIAQWQRAWLSGRILERELTFWTDVLGGELPVLDLPTDRPRPAVQTSRGAIITSTIGPGLAADLKTLSRQTGATLYMTLLSAFFMLLARETEQSDLIVGTPIANRTRKETEALIGFFVNTLAIRTRVSQEATLSEVITAVREACLEAYAHQDLPFEKLVDVLHPSRDVSRSPIFQVMFDLQNAPMAELQVTGLEFEPLEIENTTAKFDLSMTVQEADGGLILGLEYNSDLFDATTITRLLERYELILASLNRNLRTTVGSIPLLTSAERQAVLVVNQTDGVSGPALSLTTLIEQQVERTPAATAVSLEGHTLSYAALNAKANRLARWLRSRGVGPEARVGMCLDRSLDLVVTLLAILKAGGAYVPIDPVYPAARQQQIARDAELKLLLISGDIPSGSDEFPMPVQSFNHLDGELQALDDDNVPGSASPEQAAYVIFTSGSTGTPKGVVISHGALAQHIAAITDAYHLGSSDRVLQFASLSFDVAGEEIWSALVAGAAVILQPCRLFDSLPAFSQFLDRQAVTVAGVPASYWHEWIGAIEQTGFVPQSLRLVIVGNEPVASSDLDRWQRHVSPAVRWLNAYGPTETTVTASLYEPALSASGSAPSTVPIGRPLPGRSLYVLGRNLEPVPFGAPGELYIGGESLARGYLNDPKRTAAVFVPDPFSDRPGARLYTTGDRVLVRRDGTLEFLGRSDDQIKLRGFRIEPGEIEACLRRHADVGAALVRARTDNEGRVNLVAYVVPREAGPVETAALRRWLGTTLPEHMVPSLIVPLPDLPRTPAGKIDLKALPAPEWGHSGGEPSAAPATPLQRQLTAMWSEVLGVGRIGLHDNFFDLGGHSLLAVQLIARIQAVIDRPLGLMDLFQCPTVEQLAYRLEGLQAASAEVVLLREGRDLPPLFCFDPDGTHVQAYRPLALSLEDGRPVYGLSLSHLFTLRWQEVSISRLAERQTALIRERQPRGPYHLVGWSNGGVLALAVAQMLERAGEAVAFLGLLDTQPDHALYASQGPTPVDELVAYIRRDRREAFDAIAESEREALKRRLEQLDEEHRVETAIQWARDREFLSPEEAEASIGSLKLGYALAREAARFLGITRGGPIHAPAHVWWTTATTSRWGKGPVDWSEHTTGPVSVETVVGDHMDAVYSIHAHQRIGEALAAVENVQS